MRLLIILLLSPLFLFSQTQIGNDIEGLVAGDNSGFSVSISSDGKIVAIGSPSHEGNNIGQVRVFENVNNDWIQLGNTIIGENPEDHFGSSVSLSADGSIIAIGAPDNEESLELVGYVRIYENINDFWTQIGDTLYGEAEFIDSEFGWRTNFSFGRSVSVSDDGSILAIAEDLGGTFEANYSVPGNIYMYENIAGTWTQIDEVINTGISNLREISLSGDGSVVAISGDGNYDLFWGVYFGHVKVYNNTSRAWTQLGDTFSGIINLPDGGFVFDFIGGVSLNTHGSILAIGGRLSRVFQNINNLWVQEGQDIENENYYRGDHIRLSGDGTMFSLTNYFNPIDQYVARIYKNYSSTWTQIGNDVMDNEVAIYSTEISSDGTTLVIGMPYSDNNDIDDGHARVYDLSAVLSTNDYNFSQFSMYPNPAKNQFTIELSDNLELKSISIYNNLGQFVSSTSKHSTDVSNLSSGIYFVEVITNKGKSTKKLVIE